jgi:hypothetical protein
MIADGFHSGKKEVTLQDFMKGSVDLFPPWKRRTVKDRNAAHFQRIKQSPLEHVKHTLERRTRNKTYFEHKHGKDLVPSQTRSIPLPASCFLDKRLLKPRLQSW